MPEHSAPHGVVLLAAGASQRLGQPKQLLLLQGETLVRRAARFALATRPSAAAIVLGAHADAIFASVQNLNFVRVDCADWRRGMGVSLRSGLAALPSVCAGALVVVCDQPQLSADHLETLCAAWRAAPERAVASQYAGRLGVPALLPRAWFAALQSLDGDAGARELLARKSSDVTPIANESLALDIDTAADLGAW